jgi:hypothetical protein
MNSTINCILNIPVPQILYWLYGWLPNITSNCCVKKYLNCNRISVVLREKGMSSFLFSLTCGYLTTVANYFIECYGMPLEIERAICSTMVWNVRGLKTKQPQDRGGMPAEKTPQLK